MIRFNKVVISLGTNLGEKTKNLQTALKMIKEFSVFTAQSRVFLTEPWGYESKNYFLNMGLQIKTSLNPERLLSELKRIEVDMGRKRFLKNTYQDRIIDLDILTFQNTFIQSSELSIPHPKIKERKFILLILKDIYKKKTIPFLNNSADEMLLNCKDKSKVILYK